MDKLLISACLLGVNCKYNGGNNRLPEEALAALRARYELVPVCPETAGGLPTPRIPSERRDSGVWNREGEDVTGAYQKGAEAALRLARRLGCSRALLKERSPSCGSGMIYDGSFTGMLIPGRGVTAELLLEAGVTVYSEERLEELLGITK